MESKRSAFFSIMLMALIPLVYSCNRKPRLTTQEIIHRNGRVYQRTPERVFTGLVISSYPTGQLESEKSYRDGLADGPFIEWYVSGKKLSEQNYKKGKAEGIATAWYENGNKRIELNFINGLKEGECTEWYDNGNIREKGKFRGGLKDGIWNLWHINGKKISTLIVERGEATNK